MVEENIQFRLEIAVLVAGFRTLIRQLQQLADNSIGYLNTMNREYIKQAFILTTAAKEL